MRNRTAEEMLLPTVKTLRFESQFLILELSNDSYLRIPLKRFTRLLHATSEQRSNWRLATAIVGVPIEEGEGVHWPDLDEYIMLDPFGGYLIVGPKPPVGVL